MSLLRVHASGPRRAEERWWGIPISGTCSCRVYRFPTSFVAGGPKRDASRAPSGLPFTASVVFEASIIHGPLGFHPSCSRVLPGRDRETAEAPQTTQGLIAGTRCIWFTERRRATRELEVRMPGPGLSTEDTARTECNWIL